MARQGWNAHLPPVFKVSGTPLANSSTLTDVSPFGNTAGSAKTFAAQYLKEGMILRMEAYGTFSNTGTPTLLLGFYYGGIAGTALAATTAVTTTTGATNWTWRMEYKGTIRTTGATGTIMGEGVVEHPTSLTAFTPRRIPETALATVTIDTTVQKVLTVGAQWGTANASNTLTCVHFDCTIEDGFDG